jgi:hypothetical protein
MGVPCLCFDSQWLTADRPICNSWGLAQHDGLGNPASLKLGWGRNPPYKLPDPQEAELLSALAPSSSSTTAPAAAAADTAAADDAPAGLCILRCAGQTPNGTRITAFGLACSNLCLPPR